jgi:hypothetical protein
MPKPVLTVPSPSPAIKQMAKFLRKEQVRVIDRDSTTPAPRHNGSASRITGMDDERARKLAAVGWHRVR